MVEGAGLERWHVEESETEELLRYTGQRNTPVIHDETDHLTDNSPSARDRLTPLQSVFKRKLRDIQESISKNSRKSSEQHSTFRQ